MRYSLILFFSLFLATVLSHGAKKDVGEEDIDPGVIQLAPFVVYEGLVDVIDGFTGEPYHGENAVVEGFRETFNKLLLGYHRKLLINEYAFMSEHLNVAGEFIDDLNVLSATFGVEEIRYNRQSMFARERSITGRLVDDPFFVIEAMVVWDLDKLEYYKDEPLGSIYGKDIRYNKELQKWERRITTQWEVSYTKRKGPGRFYTVKEQGLNLDTNRGYHLIGKGLDGDVPPWGFKDVKLTYPIFFSSRIPVQEQIKQLRETYVRNLVQIYDPYSWVARRNTRFRLGSKFENQFSKAVSRAMIKVEDPDWFNSVMTTFLVDLVVMKHKGVKEIYDLEMLTKVRVQKNILGVGLDLLNWHPDEARSVNYDPTRINSTVVKFNNPKGARFVLLDAYRRYGNKVIDSLREKVLAQQHRKAEPVSGKELIKSVLSEASGIPADIYIKKAEKAQLAELKKFEYRLQ